MSDPHTKPARLESRGIFARCLWISVLALWPILARATAQESFLGTRSDTPFLFLVLGDSMGHGTMDGTNNFINTANAYVQKVFLSLARTSNVHFRQPYFSVEQKRLRPFLLPTNLAVDGADAFSVEGLQYYKRAGVEESFLSSDLLGDRLLPGFLKDKYDKVLYPINVLAKQPVSTMDAAVWWLTEGAPAKGIDKALVLFWIGNNESSTAALGTGGSNPESQPIPLDAIAPVIKPSLRLLLRFGQVTGEVSFEPYTQETIGRNLTAVDDFVNQYDRLISRLENASTISGVDVDLFLMTLPYYSAVGYLFDSEDIEFYLKKLEPTYTVPPTFQRVAPAGSPIDDPLRGDRVSFLTFGFMYALLATGHTSDYVNGILEKNGRQVDGLVLSEDEQRFIMSRVDSYNDTIKALAASHGSSLHVVDVGGFLNKALAGEIQLAVGDCVMSRKWVRGCGFSLDGVHPGYAGQALVANFILNEINGTVGLEAPLYDLDRQLARDPYVDKDGDGWAPGPSYEGTGLTKLIFLLKDPDDTNPEVQVELPDDVWDVMSDELLRVLLGIPAIAREAQRLGVQAPVR